jgi:cytochrome c553
MVDGYTDNSSGFEKGSTAFGFSGQIPGSANHMTGSLVCSSCHNPHAGGGPNPRLLKTVVQEVYDLYVEVEEISTGGPDGETGFQATQISAYKSGFTAWCSSCHDLLARVAGSGHSADETGLFRHATDVTATIYASYNTSVGLGIPLEDSLTIDDESTGRVTCMTCHRSHGTTAEMTGRAAEYNRLSEGGAEAETIYSSALLRISNRGVCFACHSAASRNKRVSQ